MNRHFTYFFVLAIALIIPLLLSFDKKVAFYKKWKFLFPAMILPAFFFIIWDVLFSYWFVWSFNVNYITGQRFLGLPIEEILFFFIVPYCCMFIYECVVCYFPRIQNSNKTWVLFRLIGVLLIILGVFFYHRLYTSWAFLFCGLYMEYIIFFRAGSQKRFNAAAFLVAYAIILLPFLAINGVLTSLPVVNYDNSQTLGLRIFTIPVEDVFYGMLLVMMNVTGYERWIDRTA